MFSHKFLPSFKIFNASIEKKGYPILRNFFYQNKSKSLDNFFTKM